MAYGDEELRRLLEGEDEVPADKHGESEGAPAEHAYVNIRSSG